MSSKLIKSLILTYCLAASIDAAPSAQISPVFRNLFIDDAVPPVDVDGDGDLDLVFGAFSNFVAGSTSSAAYYNDGNGQFSGPFAIDYRSKSAGDTTLIGIRKLGETSAIHRHAATLASSNWTNSEMLRIPFTTGAFIPQYVSAEPLGDKAYCETGGTIDQDGFLDYLITKDNKFIVSWGNSGGEQELFVRDDDNHFSKLIALIDIDGNGHKDIIYSGRHDGESGTCVIFQTSSRTFTPPAVLKTTNDEYIEAGMNNIADLDGNGMLDLYGTNSQNFKYHLQTSAGFGPEVSVDHTHDLEQKIGVVEKVGESAKYLYSHRDDQGNIEVHQVDYNTPSAPVTSYGLKNLLPQGDSIATTNLYNTRLLHDINADGIKDIILTVPLTDPWGQNPHAPSLVNRLCIGTGQPDGSFTFSWQGAPPLSGHYIERGSFSHVGSNNFIVGSIPNRELELLSYSNENGWERNRVLTEILPASYKSAGVSIDRVHPVDLNGNGLSDLVVRYRRPTGGNHPGYTYYCSSAMNNGSATFTLSESLPADFLNGLINHDCVIFNFADWDGDGDLDAMANGYGWYENIGNKFSPNLHFLAGGSTTVDALGNPIDFSGKGLVRDIDGDGALDLFIPAVGHHNPYGQNQSSTQAAVVYGNGNGGIGQITYYPIKLLVSDAIGNPLLLSYTLKDMNLDGKQDLIFSIPFTDAIGNPLSRYHIVYNSPNGHFQPFQSINVATAIKGVQEGDYNGDGVIDLCSISDYSSPSLSGISVSPNYRYFTSMGINNFLEMFDLDNDHDGDFLFTASNPNEGLFVGINPIVDGSDPVVRYALDAGLLAADTLPNADPENDHVTNLEEYMFGGNPATHDGTEILPQLGVDTSASPPRLTASFKRRKSLPPGRQYLVRLSPNLSSWLDYPLGTATGTSIDDTWEQLNLSIDILGYFSETRKGFIDWDVE